MTGEEFTRKNALRQAFEALSRNHAFLTEMTPLFDRHFANAVAGLRNRQAPREQRDEYLQAAEDAEELQKFVAKRIAELKRELAIPPEESTDGEE